MTISWLKNIIGKININFDFKRSNSPSLKSKNKAKKVGIQATQVNIGLTYSEVKDLVNSVVDQKLMVFKDEAEFIYNQRTDEFKRHLIEKLKKLPEEEISKLREPDTQLALMEAAKISGRKQNEELRNLLANLVVSRIKNDNSGREELKNIVYNEAISTINKLTIDQLKIITLCYLLRYTNYSGILSWATFNNHLNAHIKPFLGFKDTNAEFQHIEYAGCGSIEIVNWDLSNIYRQQHSFLFLDLAKKDLIDSLNFSDEIKKEVVALVQGEDKYFIKFRNKIDLEAYLEKNKVNDEVAKKFVSIYESHIKNKRDICKKIEDETEVGKQLLELCGKSNLTRLSLTSVGIAIAAGYFEQMTGEKINIDIWIN